MTLQELNLTLISIPIGALIGAVGIKIVIENNPTHWKWCFYIIGLAAVIYPIYQFFSKGNTLDLTTGITLGIFWVIGIFLLIFTFLFLDRKFIYESAKLDPIINRFTTIADRTEIRLFGGDLNFFGNSEVQMNNNAQYTALRGSTFARISILCEEPQNADTRTRYGKILNELPGIELRFYNPEEADLLIRGRLKKVNGVDKLLIYNKLDTGRYQLILTDTANSSGALYNNIWNLVWSLANRLSVDQRNELLAPFRR